MVVTGVTGALVIGIIALLADELTLYLRKRGDANTVAASNLISESGKGIEPF